MSRLPLDDPRWGDLRHAYGSADDMPDLLRALGNRVLSWAGDAEPMFTLWSSLWHQGDVYSASYAAVPHLLDAVPGAPPEGQRSLLQLVSSILSTSAEVDSPPVDPSTFERFEEDRARLKALAVRALDDVQDDDDSLTTLLSAIAIAKKGYRVGNFLMLVDASWECPECGEQLPGQRAND